MGVPQGSVIGPYLWNVTYDKVLRVDKLVGTEVVCYADDTLVIAVADSLEEAKTKACIMLERVLQRIETMGLKVALNKTEAAAFWRKKGGGLPKDAKMTINGTDIPIQERIKYLGIVLDSKLNYVEHFKYTSDKAMKVSRALSRLMPNLRGPSELKRKLYYNVVQSVILYNAPIWSTRLGCSVTVQRPIRRVQRFMAIRTIAGYRTISFNLATLLARAPPWHLVAEKFRYMYMKKMEAKLLGEWTPQKKKEIVTDADSAMMTAWESHLRSDTQVRHKIQEVICDHLALWQSRTHGTTNYRLTQIMSGHGCFQKFLHRIRKAETNTCLHCMVRRSVDSAEHTLFECPTWDDARNKLNSVMRCRLEWSSYIPEICKYKEKWKALSDFAQEVMRYKEDAERERERGRTRHLSDVDEEEEEEEN